MQYVFFRIGFGVQGVMKKWGFKGGPRSHGATKFHRKRGSIGSGRVRFLILVISLRFDHLNFVLIKGQKAYKRHENGWQNGTKMATSSWP